RAAVGGGDDRQHRNVRRRDRAGAGEKGLGGDAGTSRPGDSGGERAGGGAEKGRGGNPGTSRPRDAGDEPAGGRAVAALTDHGGRTADNGRAAGALKSGEGRAGGNPAGRA